jgi:hypothetical protein
VKDTDNQFKIDTGADSSVVPKYVFKKLKNIKLVKADKILFGPGQKQLQVIGKFKCELKAKSAKSNQELYVVKGLRNSLLGRPAIQSLGLLLKSDVKNVDAVQEQYSELFSGLGKTDWACERFSDYLIGKTFHIETDYTPLVSLLGSKNLEEITPKLQRFHLRLMRFRYTISHVPEKNLIIADARSRAPSRNIEKSESDFENDTTAFVDMIMESFPVSNDRLEEIRREQASDPIIQELCREGWTKQSKVRTDLLSYWPMRAEFAVHDGLLLNAGVTLSRN